MINKEKTKLKFGHFGEGLAETSLQKVIWECDDCGYERTFTYSYYNRKSKLSMERNEGKELCQKCSHKHRKTQENTKNKTSLKIKHPSQPLPKEVNIKKTIEIFGIDPRDLSAWSRRIIILDCKCGKETETKRCNLNTYKSIIETGEFKCLGCWTKERRSGTKVSDITREKQKRSQQKRRLKEKQKTFSPPKMAVASGQSHIIDNNQNTAKVIPFKK